jgi:hypothetical protein
MQKRHSDRYESAASASRACIGIRIGIRIRFRGFRVLLVFAHRFRIAFLCQKRKQALRASASQGFIL